MIFYILCKRILYVKAFKARNYYNTDTGEVVKIT